MEEQINVKKQLTYESSKWSFAMQKYLGYERYRVTELPPKGMAPKGTGRINVWGSVGSVDKLRRGDIIRSRHSFESYVVDRAYGGRVTAVRTVDVTNAFEWDVRIGGREV